MIDHRPEHTHAYVVVTGGAGGIGRGICAELRVRGYGVIAMNRSFSGDFGVEDKIPEIRCESVDLGAPESVSAALDRLASIEAPVVGVVLAAASPPLIEPIGKSARKDLAKLLEVMVLGHHQLLSGLVNGHMITRRQGAILAVLTTALDSSTNTPANSNMGIYVTAKAALRTLVSCYAEDYPWLRTGCYSPGFTDTPMLDVIDTRFVEAMRAAGKVADPVEVGKDIATAFAELAEPTAAPS